MRFNSEVRFSCSVQTLSDTDVLKDPGGGRAWLAFPSTGAMIVSGDDGHWVVSSSRAIWLRAGGNHVVQPLGQMRLKSFTFHPDSVEDLPDQSCALHVTPLLREVMRSLTQYGDLSRPCRKAVLLGELLMEKIANRAAAPIELPEPRDQRLAAICAHIQLHPDDATTLAQFAADMACSERTLHRLFLQETGMSFTVWRHQAKLVLALEWLAQGRSILDIALDLGYQNQGAFTTMFRKYLGMAPSRYGRHTPTEMPAGGSHLPAPPGRGADAQHLALA